MKGIEKTYPRYAKEIGEGHSKGYVENKKKHIEVLEPFDDLKRHAVKIKHRVSLS